MARPRKKGVDYFSHDTDASADEKIEAIRALHGNDGYAFYFILLERIYKTDNGAFNTSKPAIYAMLIKKVGVTKEKFDEMLETAFDLELFDRELFENHKIITSNGIQNRFNKIAESRATWRKNKDKEENTEEEEEENSQDTIEFSSEKTPQITPTKTPQSKVKESKGNKIKEKENKGEESSTEKSSEFLPHTPQENSNSKTSNSEEEAKSEKNSFCSSSSNCKEEVNQKSTAAKKQKSKVPYKEIVDMFNSLCISLPSVRDITPKRKKSMEKAWNFSEERQNIEFYEALFLKVEESNWLTGRATGKNWCSFKWIFDLDNMQQIIEGNYKNSNGKVKEVYIDKVHESNKSEFQKLMEKNGIKGYSDKDYFDNSKVVDANGYEIIEEV